MAAPHALMAEALKLSTEEREELLRVLLQSLDEPGEDEGHAEAWDAEIERRASGGDDAFTDGGIALRDLRDEISKE